MNVERLPVPEWFWHKAYGWGLISGSAYQGGGRGTYEVWFRGKRCYFLGIERRDWAKPWHLIRYRHWPIWVFGFCGKCGPWQCCGAVGYDHADDCDGT